MCKVCVCPQADWLGISTWPTGNPSIGELGTNPGPPFQTTKTFRDVNLVSWGGEQSFSTLGKFICFQTDKNINQRQREQKTMWLQRDQKMETVWARGIPTPMWPCVTILHCTSRIVPQLSIIAQLSTWVAWRGSVSYNQWVQTRVQVSLPNPHSVRLRYCTTPAQGLAVPYMGTDLPLLWDHGQTTQLLLFHPVTLWKAFLVLWSHMMCTVLGGVTEFAVKPS